MFMRLDKFMTNTGTATRTETAKAVRRGQITVDGSPASSPDMKIDPAVNKVYFCGEAVEYCENIYIMLNKPAGYISATDDPRAHDVTVLELLPEKYSRIGLFPCGRLDKDTVGLLILTNNGALSHRLLSPKTHCEKVYYFRTERDVENKEIIENGVELDDGYLTKLSKIELTGKREGYITLTEGKYHQIKRMFETQGNKISYLEHTEFAGVKLDRELERGEWRFLTDEERALIEKN